MLHTLQVPGGLQAPEVLEALQALQASQDQQPQVLLVSQAVEVV
jgi:hypothetical protein